MSRDKQNIKTTDWLTRGMTEAEIAKVKEEAIDEADAELRDKQIEEMAVELWHNTTIREADMCDDVAEYLYNAGYRKIYDDHQRQCTCYALGCQMAEGLEKKVAREIFEEIEELLNLQAKIVCETRDKYRETDEPMLSFIAMLDGRIYSLRVVEEHIAELKKKYTEDKDV